MNDRNTPLLDNQYVKELLSILDGNGKDPSGLSALLSHVGEMEAFVRHAENRISEMKEQLDSIREIQNHPLKAVLRNAVRSLEQTLEKMKKHVNAVKTGIAEGCEKAVRAFKDTGISALDKLTSFFNTKGELQELSRLIDVGIKADDRAVEKIEAFSKEYHSAGRAFKNMARVITGRKPVDTKKESGKLARAISMPYKTHKFIMLKIKANVNKSITRLEELQSKAWAKRAARAAPKQPSIMEKLQKNLDFVEQTKREHRVRELVAAKGAEL